MRNLRLAVVGCTCLLLSAHLYVVSGSGSIFQKRDDLSPVATPRADQLSMWVQSPILDEESTSGVEHAFLAADATCDHSTYCGSSRRSAALGHPEEYDGTPDWVRFSKVVVWGVYDGGAPPLVDSFRVLAHPSNGVDYPGPVVCDESGIAGTREIVGSLFGRDVYRHVLMLSNPCTVDMVLQGSQVEWYFIEVFNDTGVSGDWLWIEGWPGYSPHFPPTFRTFAAWEAPGEIFGADWVPRAFEVGGAPGESSELQLSKLPEGEIRLEWAPDCGAARQYSVYRGDLGEGLDSLAAEPGLCEVSGTSVEIDAGEGAADFFLVVPIAVIMGFGPPIGIFSASGSYGADSDGNPRLQPPIDRRCTRQSTLDGCAP